MAKHRNKLNKKVPKVIDLSQNDEEKKSLDEFEVKDYDYKDLQGTDDPFEKDLDFLLQNKKSGIELREEPSVDVVDVKVNESPQIKRNGGGRKPRKMKVKVDDITKDIEDITFSSSEEEEENMSPTKTGKGKKKKNSAVAKKKVAQALKEEDSAEDLDISIASKFAEGNLESSEDSKKKISKKKSTAVLKDTTNEQSQTILKDGQSATKSLNKKKSRRQLNPKTNTTDLKEEALVTEDVVITPKSARRKRQNKATDHSPATNDISPTKSNRKKSIKGSKLQLPLPEQIEEDLATSDIQIKTDNKVGTYIDDGKPITSQSDQSVLVGKNNELITVEELKKKKVIDQEYSIYDSELNLSRNQRKQKLNEQLQQEQQSNSESISPESSPDTPIKQTALLDRLPYSTPRKPSLNGITNTPTRDIVNGTLNGSNNSFTNTPEKNENPFAINLRSTKKTISNGKYSENLPEIRPTKTIIGLTHKQILNLSLSDVKIKAITSSTLTVKFVANILKFTLKNSHEIFDDVDIRTKFMKLCTNVALYESIGFKKTCKEFDVEEYFGKYSEITLETTGTKLTPPAENIHQNQFDYSVLSFIGHVLLWAYSLQVKAGISPTLAEKYPDLELDRDIIRKHLGGDHLWDRLRRSDSTVNTKRWKHINKFRESFGFYEDQFMLILRFLNVDATIP